MGDTIILESEPNGDYKIKGTNHVVIVGDGGIGVVLNEKNEEI